MGAVFTKTARGKAELSLRSGALTPRARRVLILVDGRRTVDDLDALIQSETLRNTLGQLEEDGFIEYIEAAVTGTEAASSQAPAPPPVAAASGTPTSGPFGALPDPADPKRLRQARGIMSEAIHNFVGNFGTKGMLRQIAEAQSLHDLRSLYDDWLAVITNSLESPWEVSDLRDKLLRVI